MFYDVDPKKIDKLAHLSIKRGVALQKGQNLLITAPLESLPLVRKIVEYAYKEGAGIVTPLFNDSDITLSRFKYGNDESFNVAANWLYNGMGEAFDNNTARMAIAGDDPMLLSEIDPDKVSRANKANAVKLVEFLLTPESQEHFTNNTFEFPMIDGVSPSPLVVNNLGLDFKQDMKTKLASYGKNQAAAVEVMTAAGWK